MDETLNTAGKTVGTNDGALKTVGKTVDKTVDTNDDAFKAVIDGNSIDDLKKGVQIAMSQPLQPATSTHLSPGPPPPPLRPRFPPPTSPPPADELLYTDELNEDQAFKAAIVGTSIEDMKKGMSQPPQPAPSTPLSTRPPPPPLSPRPPPPTSPPPANESLYKYELTSQTLVDRSTILDRSLLPSHRQSQPTAVSQSKPQSQPTAVPQSKPQEPEPEPAVDERQLVLYHRMRSTLNLSRNMNNARSYISRYGTLSETCPFGERVWDGLHQDFIGYRFSDHMTGRRFLGWFLCPTAFSQENAGRPAEPGDSVWYPAVFCDVYWSDGEYVYMACLHIILMQCRPWKVHRTRIIIVVEMMV
jgi:hypothetical protein